MSGLANRITYSTAQLNMRRGDVILATGSGAIYRKEGFYFLITSWHNLSGRHTETLKLLDSKFGSIPDNILVNIGFHNKGDHGSGYYRVPIVIPLASSAGPMYFVHKQSWPRVDVAVIPIFPENDYAFEVSLSDGTTQKYSQPLVYTDTGGTVQTLPFLERESEASLIDEEDDFEIEHSVGDDLFLVGFPAGVVDHYVNPIWKRASFATSFWHDWLGQRMFVVDSASRRGMSGCIALYYNKNGVVPVEAGSSYIISRPIKILHGIYAGRYGDSEFEAQVGRVWKMDIVDEIIEDGRRAINSEEIEIALSEVRDMILSEWPEHAGACDDYIAHKAPLIYFCHFILEKLDGRADVNFVRAEILEMAKTKSASSV